MKKEVAISLILLFLAIVGFLFSPGFWSPFNISNNLNQVGLYGVFSIGAGIVIITGGIDLSVGSVFALQGVILAMAINVWHWPVPLALGLSVATVLVIGAFHGFNVTVVKLQPFIVTLCGLLFYRGIARWIAGDQSLGFDGDKYVWLTKVCTHRFVLHDFTMANGKVQSLSITMPFLILIAASIVMWVVLHKSVYGRYLYAVGRNEEAARFSGINTRLVIGSAYVLGMLLAGISGFLLLLDTGSVAPSGFAESYELYGIAAAVLGGCSLRGGEGSILGIVLGTALIVILRNLVPLLGIISSLEFAVLGAVIYMGVTVDQVIGNRKRRGKSPSLVATPTGFPVVPAPTGAGGQTPSA